MTDAMAAAPPLFRELLEETETSAELESFMACLEPETLSRPAPVSRLMALVEEAPLRHAPFFRRTAELFGISESEAEALLGSDAWRKAPLPGIQFKEVGGNAESGTVNTLVRFAAKTKFPRHRHVNHEKLLILEGGYTDDQGTHFGPGDVHEMPVGSEHAFVIDADGPCIAASVGDESLQFTSWFMRALAKLVGR